MHRLLYAGLFVGILLAGMGAAGCQSDKSKSKYDVQVFRMYADTNLTEMSEVVGVAAAAIESRVEQTEKSNTARVLEVWTQTQEPLQVILTLRDTATVGLSIGGSWSGAEGLSLRLLAKIQGEYDRRHAPKAVLPTAPANSSSTR